jgi:hypothetical protein
MSHLGVILKNPSSSFSIINEKDKEVFKKEFIGLSLFTNTIKEIIDTLINELLINEQSLTDIQTVTIFIHGKDSKKDYKKIQKEIYQKVPFFNKITVEILNLSSLILFASNKLTNTIGILIDDDIIGICESENNKTTSILSPSYDYSFGSIYYILNNILISIIKIIDSRKSPSKFSEFIMDYLNINSKTNVIDLFLNLKEDNIQEIINSCLDYAQNFDSVAYSIVESSINETLLIIDALYTKLSYTGASIVIVGSLAENKFYYSLLVRMMLRKHSDIVVVKQTKKLSYLASLYSKQIYGTH